MAPVGKKARRPIGSMPGTIVQDTPNQDNNGDSDGSDDNSSNSDIHISASDESDHDETQSNDSTNEQELEVRRGHAKMGFEWGTGKVMQVELKDNHVVGDNAVFFSSQLGILAKDGNKLPLSYTDWRAVPHPSKDLIWAEVKKLSRTNKKSRKQVKLPARMGRKDMANAIEEYRREHGKEPSKLDLFIYTRKGKSIGTPTTPADKIIKEKIDDIRANDEIYDEVIGIDAPGCLRGSIVGTKNKNVTFTTREEFDRAVQDRANEVVADIRKGFEEEMSKFKDDHRSDMEMLKARLLTLEGKNVNDSVSFNPQRILALRDESSSQSLLNSKNLSEATKTSEVRKEMNNSSETETDIPLDDEHVEEQVKGVTKKKKFKTK